MKHLVTVLFVLLICSVASAETVTLQVEKSFNPPEAEYEATEWRLYKDGAYIGMPCAEQTNGFLQCGPFDTPAGEFPWTLTVMYENGSESPQSAPYQFTIPISDPELPIPTIEGLEIL